MEEGEGAVVQRRINHADVGSEALTPTVGVDKMGPFRPPLPFILSRHGTGEFLFRMSFQLWAP